MVIVLLALNCVNIIFAIDSVWSLSVDQFGNIFALALAPITYSLTPVLSGVVASIAQVFFINRLYVLSKSRILPIMLLICVLVQLAFSITLTCKIFSLDRQLLRFNEFL